MSMKKTKELARIVSAHIKNYDLFIFQDVATVAAEQGIVTKQRVAGLSDFVAAAKATRNGEREMETVEL